MLGPVHLGETGYAQVINEFGAVMIGSDSVSENTSFQVTAHSDHFTELLREGQDGVWICHRRALGSGHPPGRG